MAVPPEQAEAADFLRGLAGSDPVQTHISLVFVGTDTVWKLKKAVRLAFLDFTSVDARRRFALRELELNSRRRPVYIAMWCRSCAAPTACWRWATRATRRCRSSTGYCGWPTSRRRTSSMQSRLRAS